MRASPFSLAIPALLRFTRCLRKHLKIRYAKHELRALCLRCNTGIRFRLNTLLDTLIEGFLIPA